MEIADELKAKAPTCETAEELLVLAAKNGIELTFEDAESILQDLAETHEGELADEELEDVAGGDGACPKITHTQVFWDRKEDVQYIFNVGDIVRAVSGLHLAPVSCRVADRQADDGSVGKWRDEYWLEPQEKKAFMKRWRGRNLIFL